MVDSGAFSAWSKGVQVSLNPYIFWLLCNEGYIGHYFNRDVIAGENGRRERCRHKIEQAAAQSYFNFRRMKRARLNPIPVFHQNERFFWLRRYLDEGAQYIALAPFHATRPEGIAWLRDAFALVANYPNVKVHGLGVMSHFAVCKFPFYSVDAATWLRGGSRGQIPVPFFRDGHLDYERRPKTLNVNDLAQADGLLHARFEQFAALVGVSEAEVVDTIKARWAMWIDWFMGLERHTGVRLCLVFSAGPEISALVAGGVEHRMVAYPRVKNYSAERLRALAPPA